ncbi:hypothetical protein ZIOFF_033352 [Zingiber officinale]|uniref:Uncharacterized protein n=1 Tax=Zingiber officinale TaxID=94328 RepID=A0A8J5LCG0_ZINOF|nr:hypothetical protein ZIOFF_033352 [Zingiber officinale]
MSTQQFKDAELLRVFADYQFLSNASTHQIHHLCKSLVRTQAMHLDRQQFFSITFLSHFAYPSFSDTGIRSNLVEFHGLDVGVHSISCDKWDGVLSITTTGDIAEDSMFAIEDSCAQSYVMEDSRAVVGQNHVNFCYDLGSRLFSIHGSILLDNNIFSDDTLGIELFRSGTKDKVIYKYHLNLREALASDSWLHKLPSIHKSHGTFRQAFHCTCLLCSFHLSIHQPIDVVISFVVLNCEYGKLNLVEPKYAFPLQRKRTLMCSWNGCFPLFKRFASVSENLYPLSKQQVQYKSDK